MTLYYITVQLHGHEELEPEPRDRHQRGGRTLRRRVGLARLHRADAIETGRYVVTNQRRELVVYDEYDDV